MRKRTTALLAVAVTCGSILATASAASAEPNPPNCPKGYVCIYSGYDETGSLLVRSAGNWTGSTSAGSVFNNGLPDPGLDHIQLTWVYLGATFSRCLHYNPGPGTYKMDLGS